MNCSLDTGGQFQAQDKILQDSSCKGVDALGSQPDIQSTAQQCQSVPFVCYLWTNFEPPLQIDTEGPGGRAALSINGWCASDSPGVVMKSGQDLPNSPPWMPSLGFTHMAHPESPWPYVPTLHWLAVGTQKVWAKTKRQWNLKSVDGFIAQCLTSASSRQTTLIPNLLFTLRNPKFNEVHARQTHKTTAVQWIFPAGEVGRARV